MYVTTENKLKLGVEMLISNPEGKELFPLLHSEENSHKATD